MAETQKLAREMPKFILRFSEELRDKIKAEAERNKRSMTAEIVQLIEDGFEQRADKEWLEARFRETQEDQSVQAAIEEHERQMEKDERYRRLGKRASMILHPPKDDTRANMILTPDGMSRDEMSALLEQALEHSHRRAMDLFQLMVIEKGGRVVPIGDDEEKS